MLDIQQASPVPCFHLEATSYQYNALEWLEEHGVGYVVKMRMKQDLWSAVLTLSGGVYRTEETEAGPVELCSLSYKRHRWSRPRRLVIVRWAAESERAQTDLFDALGYTYAVFVTNLDWDEQDLYRFYDKRADIENHIQEAKADLGIGHGRQPSGINLR